MTQGARGREDEIKARVRVAMVYDNRTWDQLALKFGISKKTIQRWLQEDSTSGEARREKLAQMCNVPAWFMLEGFAETTGRQQPEDASVRLDRLEREASELRALLAAEGRRQSEA